jgi:hypothetical protein
MSNSALAGSQLDFWVAKAEGIDPTVDAQMKFTPSTDWAHGGPLIDREGIRIAPLDEAAFREGYGLPRHPLRR